MILPTLLCFAGMGLQFSAPQAQTELVPSAKTIQAGKPFRVAMHMKMKPSWHSYYSNPGESGAATTIQWKLPIGFTAGPIQWPEPTRIVVGGVAGYVYENDAWLVTEIVPPRNLSSGRSVRIAANVNWLLCREACVPQKSSLEVIVKVGPALVPNPAFEPALSHLSAPSAALSVKAVANSKAAVLSIPGEGAPSPDLKFFPADATYFGADLAQMKPTSTGINLVVPLSKYAPGPPKRLTGILVIPSGPTKGVHWIDVKVTEH